MDVRLQSVSKHYSLGKVTVPALENVDLCVQRGQFVAVKGPSGSGKTTLLNIIGTLDRPSSGSLSVFGRALHNEKEKNLTIFRRQFIGFIFQNFNLIPTLRVTENIAYPMLSFSVSIYEQQQRIQSLLEAVDLTGYGRRFPHELSGGQRQRVAIARALVNNPALVLADEPTANLDSETGSAIIELLHTLKEASNTLVILSTHDPEIVNRSDTIYILKDGHIELEQGGAS